MVEVVVEEVVNGVVLVVLQVDLGRIGLGSSFKAKTSAMTIMIVKIVKAHITAMAILAFKDREAIPYAFLEEY